MVTYRHPEAFCLMTYRCERCRAVEIVWNSRDGVTPFVISCVQGHPHVPYTRCGGSMQHVDWNLDRCVPEHQPQPGDRFFRDATVEDYVALYDRRKGAGQLPLTFDVKAAAEQAIVEHGEAPPWMETTV